MSVVAPRNGDLEPSGSAMFYSAAALKLVEEFKEHLGRMATTSALENAKRDGRNLVTDEDVRQVIDQVVHRAGWPIPDEAQDDG